MCYPKPGPRCSAHAEAALQRAYNSGDKDKIAAAKLDYYTTPKGLSELSKSGGKDAVYKKFLKRREDLLTAVREARKDVKEEELSPSELKALDAERERQERAEQAKKARSELRKKRAQEKEELAVLEAEYKNKPKQVVKPEPKTAKVDEPKQNPAIWGTPTKPEMVFPAGMNSADSPETSHIPDVLAITERELVNDQGYFVPPTFMKEQNSGVNWFSGTSQENLRVSTELHLKVVKKVEQNSEYVRLAQEANELGIEKTLTSSGRSLKYTPVLVAYLDPNNQLESVGRSHLYNTDITVKEFRELSNNASGYMMPLNDKGIEELKREIKNKRRENRKKKIESFFSRAKDSILQDSKTTIPNAREILAQNASGYITASEGYSPEERVRNRFYDTMTEVPTPLSSAKISI